LITETALASADFRRYLQGSEDSETCYCSIITSQDIPEDQRWTIKEAGHRAANHAAKPDAKK
jgi:hypothetical protein